MEKIIEIMKQGKIMMVGECRGAQVKVVKYVDKKSGQAASFTAIHYLVEISGGHEAVKVTQNVGQGEIDPTTIKPTTQKGKIYAFELSGLEKVRGVLKARMKAGTVPLPI